MLGIDPGLVRTGWGVVKKSGYNFEYVDCGVIKTESSDQMEIRLSSIYDSVYELIEKFSPSEISMEEVFVNTNLKTSQKLIMARSAAFISAANKGYKVNEYTPNEVKKNITGHGHAQKNQIHVMVQKILNVEIEKNSKTKTLDSMDAIAVALCHAFTLNSVFMAK